MLRRIGTCRKKVMGLLRLMGNKADVVKGLAKRCNENWSVAPKSDIGLYLSDIQVRVRFVVGATNMGTYPRGHENARARMTDAAPTATPTALLGKRNDIPANQPPRRSATN